MSCRPSSVGRGISILAATFLILGVGCTRPRPCQDPTNEGVCFCPVGVSCHHECGATEHCTLGCSQANPSCSVSCAEDCTALCAGAGQCRATCGRRCNVSCEWVKERCLANVGASSHVNCEGAADCQVQCQGPCTVDCPRGRCRLRCPTEADAEQENGCEMSCGGVGAQSHPATCADGTLVCGQPC